jgi:hypothetical protein
MSDDPGSRRDGGYLPPAPRGQYVTAFDSAGWTLAPGAMSGLVETPFGYHIIRRPPSAEVRDRLLAFARERLGVQLDSMYLDSLATRYKLRVEGGAAPALRAAITDRTTAVRSKQALARYEGGELTVADFMRWAASLPPSWGSQMLQQPDSSLTAFVEIIGKNELLLQEADRAGIQATPVEWASMYETFRAQIDTLRMNLGLSAEISDAGAVNDRARVAAAKIKASGTSSRRRRPRPIPRNWLRPAPGSRFLGGPAGIVRAIDSRPRSRPEGGTAGRPAGEPVRLRSSPGGAGR